MSQVQAHHDGARFTGQVSYGPFYNPNQPVPEPLVKASLLDTDRKLFLLACKRRAIAEMESTGQPAVAWTSFSSDITKWEGEGELYSSSQIAMFTSMAMMNMKSLSQMKHFIEGFN